MNLSFLHLAICQLIFALVGCFDWLLKDNYIMTGQESTTMPKIYGATIWGCICWGMCGVSVFILSLCLDNWWILILLTGIFTEDTIYFVLRSVHYNQKYTDTYWMPFGLGSTPIRPLLISHTVILTITIILIIIGV